MKCLLRDNPIELEKVGKDPLLEARIKNGLANIRDTNWQRTNPVKMLEKVLVVPPNTLSNDVNFQSRLYTAAVIPFAVPFPKLCCEVAKLCDMGAKTL